MNDSFMAIVAAGALFLFCSRAAAAPPPSPQAPAPSPTTGQSAAALFAQAQVDAASGRNQAARDELQRASALDPGNMTILRLLGDVEYRLEHFAAAETAYKAVIQKDPTDRAVHNRLGGVYAAENRIDDAIAQFRLSLPSQEGTTNLVEVYQEEGKLKELEAEEQLDMDRAPPDDPYSRFELATALAAQKRYGEAIVPDAHAS